MKKSGQVNHLISLNLTDNSEEFSTEGIEVSSLHQGSKVNEEELPFVIFAALV